MAGYLKVSQHNNNLVNEKKRILYHTTMNIPCACFCRPLLLFNKIFPEKPTQAL